MEKQPPYIAVVINDRQKAKAPKGKQVEVQRFGIGQYGRYALVFVDGKDKPVFLNPDNIEYFSDVSAERLAEIEAERQAYRDKGNAPVYIGPPDWESDRAVGMNFGRKDRIFFPKETRKGVVLYNQTDFTVPQWLWDAKKKEHPYITAPVKEE